MPVNVCGKREKSVVSNYYLNSIKTATTTK